ncbi:hypothetical protein KEM56_002919, partial [Ascosphaera pollenicola]
SLTGRKPLGSLIRTIELHVRKEDKPGVVYDFDFEIDFKDDDEVTQYAARVIKRIADGLIYIKARYASIDYRWLQEVKYCKALSCLDLLSFTFVLVTYADILHVVEHLDSLEVLILPDPEPDDFEELATQQTKISVKWPTNLHHISCRDCDHETEVIPRVFPNIRTLFINDLLHNGLLRRFIHTDAIYPMTDMFLGFGLDDRIVAEFSVALRNGLRNLRRVYFRRGNALDRQSSHVKEMILATHAVLKNMVVRRPFSSNAMDGPTQHDEGETGVYLYDRQEPQDTGGNTVTVIYGWSFDGSRFQLSDALNGFSDWELQRYPVHHYLRWRGPTSRCS